MADIYYQTPVSLGIVTSDDDVPAGATILTKAQYDAVLAGYEAAEQQLRDVAREQAEERWTTVHDDLIASGVSVSAATILANVVGVEPAGG
jgi:hypothetical protein